ncbi:chitinase, partial [Streptomyces sp. NPDC046881]
ADDTGSPVEERGLPVGFRRLDLTAGTNCGAFKPSKTYPALRGARTWSTNWDTASGNAWSNPVGAHVHALP